MIASGPISFVARACAAALLCASLAWIAPASAQYATAQFEAGQAQIEKREACEALRDREHRRCLRRAEVEARASDARFERLRRASQAYRLRLADAVAAERNPRALALAALLRTDRIGEFPIADPGDASRNAAVARAWALQALAQGGDDPLVQMLVMDMPNATEAFDGDEPRAAAVARWHALDPDNLAPLMLMHTSATSAAGGGRATLDDRFFPAARGAARFDLYFDDVLREVVRAVRRYPPDTAARRSLLSEEYATVDAYAYGLGVSLWAASVIPEMLPLITGCERDALTAIGSRRDDCAHIAAVMQRHSDTLIGELFGIAIARKLARDDNERDATAKQRRRSEWRSAQWRIAIESDRATPCTGMVAALMNSEDISEMALMERTIEHAGLPLEPPPDWDSGYRFPDERDTETADGAQEPSAGDSRRDSMPPDPESRRP